MIQFYQFVVFHCRLQSPKYFFLPMIEMLNITDILTVGMKEYGSFFLLF